MQQEEIDIVVNKVKEYLLIAEKDNIYLKVISSNFDCDWLHIDLSLCRTLVKPKERASDHANLMSKIEKELRLQGHDNIILLPEILD